MARKCGLVKAAFLVSDGIRSLCVARREQIGRIYAARKEGFLVGKLPVAQLLAEDLVDDSAYLLCELVGGFALVRLKNGLPVARKGHALAVELGEVTRAKLENALVKGLGANRVAVEKILLEHAAVELLFDARIGNDLVDIAGANERAVRDGIEHLLLTHLIAEAVNLTAVADGKGKRTVKVVGKRNAPFFKALCNDLLLSLSAGKRQLDLKLFAELPEIADIAAVVTNLYHDVPPCRLLSEL